MLSKFFNSLKNDFSISWIVYIFLGIVAFNFADSFITLVILSIVANIILLIFIRKRLDIEFLLTLILSVIPLFSVAIFAMTSKFNLDPNANYSTSKYIFLILSTFSVPFLGFQSRACGKFEIKKALKVIYVMLAIWMLINFFITIIQFGPFYTFIYKDRYFFDYGHIASMPINNIAYMLLGFKVERVSTELFCLVAGVLSSAILGVFFTSRKDDKRSFFVYLICGSIGLLCIILTLSTSLILGYIALLVSFTLIVLFGKKILTFNKPVKIVTFSLCGIAGLLYIVFMLSALNVQPLAGSIEGNFALNKFFNANRVIGKFHKITRAMVDSKCINGFTPMLIGRDSITLSGSWLFDMFPIAQLFGWIAFIVFIVVIFIRFAKYAKSSEDDLSSKVLLMGVVLSIILFSGVCYNSTPFLDNENYLPLFFIAPFILLIFVSGYIGENKEEITI